MQPTHISSTYLKNNTADVMNDVYFHGKHVIVERYGKPIIELKPVVSAGDKPHPLRSLFGTISEEDADSMINAIEKGKTIKKTAPRL
jgi:antitoxin (DNA-binding transcriptional repressor) of toxin-antitoxin stability system